MMEKLERSSVGDSERTASTLSDCDKQKKDIKFSDKSDHGVHYVIT